MGLASVVEPAVVELLAGSAEESVELLALT
jgi:hypothetical protein